MKYLLPYEKFEYDQRIIVRYKLNEKYANNYVGTIIKNNRGLYVARYYVFRVLKLIGEYCSLEKAKSELDKVLVENEYVLIPEDKVDQYKILL